MVEEPVGEEHSGYLAESSAPARMPSLRVFFFGQFEMLCDGNAMQLGRNGNALTILKYLLANRRRPARRTT
jgi:hypothetical protein